MGGEAHHYGSLEVKGVIALTVGSGISFVAVVGLLLVMVISSIRATKARATDKTTPVFLRTHVGIYLFSLLLCDLFSSVGALINIEWISDMGVQIGADCTAQAVLYQLGNVGSALWAVTIAAHTFVLLFLRWNVSDVACAVTVTAGWALTILLVIIGPVGLQNNMKGSFHGIAGSWCWITEEYTDARLALEYFWMFYSAFTSFALYFLIFLRLRGNIKGTGLNLHLHWTKGSSAWRERDSPDSYVTNVARQMLWYPVAYTIVILPIATCRWAAFGGRTVPFWASLMSNVIFSLAGLINVILYSTTRQVITKKSILPTSAKFPKLDFIHRMHTNTTKDTFSPSSVYTFETKRPRQTTSPISPPLPSPPPAAETRPAYRGSPPPARPISMSSYASSESFCDDCEECQKRKAARQNSVRGRPEIPVPVLVRTPPTPEPGQESFDDRWSTDSPSMSTVDLFPLTRQ